jgi:hypothetical protein
MIKETIKKSKRITEKRALTNKLKLKCERQQGNIFVPKEEKYEKYYIHKKYN